VGHDLSKIAEAAIRVCTLRPLEIPGAGGTARSAEHYRRHRLRYAGVHDIFLRSKSIQTERLLDWFVGPEAKAAGGTETVLARAAALFGASPPVVP
jgi:hypothetical protein